MCFSEETRCVWNVEMCLKRQQNDKTWSYKAILQCYDIRYLLICQILVQQISPTILRAPWRILNQNMWLDLGNMCYYFSLQNSNFWPSQGTKYHWYDPKAEKVLQQAVTHTHTHMNGHTALGTVKISAWEFSSSYNWVSLTKQLNSIECFLMVSPRRSRYE